MTDQTTHADAMDDAVTDIHEALEGDVEGPTWVGVPLAEGSEIPVYEALVNELGDPVAGVRAMDEALAELWQAVHEVAGADRRPVPELAPVREALGELTEVDPADWRTVVEEPEE